MKENRTLLGYVATRVLDTPFWGIYNLLPFILYKDLGATPFQIALLVMLKPVVSFLSMYWSSYVRGRPDRLVDNILWARALGYFPFLLVPFVSSPWYFIAIYSFYMMLSVGIVPAWMEILKVNLPKEKREKTFAYTQAFGYLGGGLFPVLLGTIMDSSFEAWRWVFPAAAIIGFSAFIFQRRIVVDTEEIIETTSSKVVDKIKEPWHSAVNLLKERVDFRKFQIGFMFLGSGLMIIYPAIPLYVVDTLNLSYTELSVAIGLCKGIGFIVASPSWTRSINKIDIFSFTSLVAALACLFPFFLILAQTQIAWLYIAYFLYGMVQAGSELCWNMSGPIFSREKESSLFSSINVIAVGLRGTIIPAIGSLIILWFSSSGVMMLGGFICLMGAVLLSRYSKQFAPSVT